MNILCDTEILVKNEFAVWFPVVKPVSLLDYIKIVSSSMGASHILAVYEQNDTIKMFFDEKKCVDTLIKSGIHVMGHHIKVDYVVPPGSKVVLSDIHPAISNYDLTKFLSTYGTVMSPIIRAPLSDDAEFCHIDVGVRYVYMALSESIPNAAEIKFGDQSCTVTVKVDDSSMIPYVKADIDSFVELYSNVATSDAIAEPFIVEPYILDNSDGSDASNPVVVSVQSATCLEINSNEEVDPSALSIQKSFVKRKRLRRTLKRTKVSSTSQTARRIRRTVQHKWLTGQKRKQIKKIKRGRKRVRKDKNVLPLALLSSSPTNSNADNSLTPTLLINNDVKSEEDSNGILEEEKLKLFIEEVKHHRAPMELAKKYLGSDSKDVLLQLISQLSEFNRSHGHQSLKIRIGRLINTLKESM